MGQGPEARDGGTGSDARSPSPRAGETGAEAQGPGRTGAPPDPPDATGPGGPPPAPWTATVPPRGILRGAGPGIAVALLVLAAYLLFQRPWAGIRRASAGDRGAPHVEEARELLESGRADEAAVAFGRALGADPENRDAHLGLARLYGERGLREAAEAEYRAALGIREDAGTWIALGLLQVGGKDIAGAAESFRAAARIEPASWVAWYNLGYALYQREDWEGSAEASEEAWRLHPGCLEAAHNAGAALRRLGRPDRAIPLLEAVVAARPDWAISGNELGICYEEKGRTAEAREVYARVLAVSPGNVFAGERLREIGP